MFNQRVENDQEKYISTKRQKPWKWIILAIVSVIVIVAAVVPAVVVTRNNKNRDETTQVPQGNDTDTGNTNGTDTTGTRPGGSPPKAPEDGIDINNTTGVINLGNSDYPVSAFAHMIGIITNKSPTLKAKKRVFVIGDVHGCLQELNQLVDSLGFDASRDQLILAGDLTAKGPDSIGVIRRAKELGALCVRGNHDDKVIRFKTYQLQNGNTIPKKGTMPEGDVEDPLKFNDEHAQIALDMNQDDYDYLSSCPVILHLPQLNNTIVVHGGLDPNVNSLTDQVSYLVMNMRDIDKDNQPTKDKKVGVQWATEWNTRQRANALGINSASIFYGHDASRGLNIQENTFGVDSGCVSGRLLTAINVASKELTQVKCKTYYE